MELKFCERLKELRLEKGMGQIELANRLGVSKSSISIWEKGESYPSIISLYYIAKFFNVSADYLLGLND